MPGVGFSKSINRKVPFEKSTLKPYWGKLAVRNFREGLGNNGIIRSPFSARTLLDRFSLPSFYRFRVALIGPLQGLLRS
jgi:hypothetical protein